VAHIKHIADTDAQIKEWGCKNFNTVWYTLQLSRIWKRQSCRQNTFRCLSLSDEDSLSLRLEQFRVGPDILFPVLSNQACSIQFELLKVW